jgi:dihydrolipoamide dehydrogenase
MTNWVKPKKFDTNLVVIGAGAAGLVTAYIAAAVKAKVTLIEKHQMGGDCLNTGCVPSKALLRSAKFISDNRRAVDFGMNSASVEFDFATVMERVQHIINTIAPHDSIARYSELGVDVIIGSGKIISPWQVEIKTADATRIISSKAIVIATGAKPYIPPIEGLAEVGYLTSDTVWQLREQPKRLLVLGGGAIGCELAQAFASLGCQVTQVESLPRLMSREDEDVSALVLAKFQQQGIKVLLTHTAKKFSLEHGEKLLIAEYQGQTVRIAFDQILIAVGRAANLTGYGIEEMGIALSERHTIAVNAFQATNYPTIYACGDVAGPYQFTHTAAHQAWYAAVNALFSPFKKFRTDYSVIPYASFIDPEIARVGLNEQDAKQQGIAYQISYYPLSELDRAITDSETQGFIKVLTPPNKDKILGVTIVGNHASDLLAEFVLAMKYNLGLNKVLNTIHIYPTMAEANKYVAGVWKRNHAPKKLLQWLSCFHRWRR